MTQTLKISISQLPKDVVAKIKKRFPKGEIIRAAKSAPQPMDEGVEYFFVTVMDGKQEYKTVFYGTEMVSVSKAPELSDSPK